LVLDYCTISCTPAGQHTRDPIACLPGHPRSYRCHFDAVSQHCKVCKKAGQANQGRRFWRSIYS
jgi:hypothetical protein